MAQQDVAEREKCHRHSETFDHEKPVQLRYGDIELVEMCIRDSANVMGTLNVLEYARTAGADRVLYTQTISDYTGYFGEMIELADDMPRKPAMTGDHAVYAITKIAAEELCWHYRAAYGMGFFAFRLPNIYCFMHDSKTLYHDGKPAVSSYRLMIDKARAGEPLEIWGDPTKGMDLIYVKDFCQMIEKALFAPKEASGTYNVGTGVLLSLIHI